MIWANFRLAAVAAAVGVIGLSGPAQAITGTTEITVTWEDRGPFVLRPLGTATLTDNTFAFPITGGSILSGGSTIEHEGSGIGFDNLEPVSEYYALTNLLIDVDAGFVFSDIFRLGSEPEENVPSFAFGTGTEIPGVQLLFSEPVFRPRPPGAPPYRPYAGEEFGYAVVAPVPLPTALPLTLAGVGALGCVGWGRRRRTVDAQVG